MYKESVKETLILFKITIFGSFLLSPGLRSGKKRPPLRRREQGQASGKAAARAVPGGDDLILARRTRENKGSGGLLRQREELPAQAENFFGAKGVEKADLAGVGAGIPEAVLVQAAAELGRDARVAVDELRLRR